MGDVHGVVDTEPDGHHDVDHGDCVEGGAPEVEEADDVDEGEDDAEEDEEGEAERGEFVREVAVLACLEVLLPR